MAVETTKTEVGSYFIANYPPFSVWSQEAVERGPGRVLRNLQMPALSWA